jgi:Fungal trichothecene efflux pump (TRI12)
MSLDLTGFVLFASIAVMSLLALEWGGTKYPWNSAVIIGLFCGAGVTLCIFTAWEYRIGDDAMIPFSIVSKRIVWCSCLVLAFFGSSIFLFSYYLPLYFQAVKGASPALSGVYLLPGILTQIIAAAVSGLLGQYQIYIRQLVND